jgi:hypothetical protein
VANRLERKLRGAVEAALWASFPSFVNRTAFHPNGATELFRGSIVDAGFSRGKVMTKSLSASANPRTQRLPVEDRQPLTLLRRLIIEIEDSISQSREVILSTRDAIELLERLQGRQFSN